MSKFLFIKEAMTNFKQVGAIASSSRFLAKKMMFSMRFHRDNIVVELGSGDGYLTKHLLSKLSKKSKLYIFEINDNFLHLLKKKVDDRLIVINESAAILDQYLQPESADYIISSLPLANISAEVKNDIITQACKVLKKDGLFVQYQYSLVDYAKLKKHFSEVKLVFTLLNIPPAFVYICKK